MQRLRFVALVTLAAIATIPPVYGQTARSGGAPNAQMLQQLQQLAGERTSLQAENAKLKKELEDLRKEREQLSKGSDAGTRRAQASEAALARSVAQREATERDLEQTKARTQELVAKFRETIQQLREVEAQSTASRQALATRDQELKTCVDHNMSLYNLNGEVLTRLEKQGVWSRVAQAEPFTRIKRAQLDNLIDDYKSRAEDQRILETPKDTPTPSPPPPGTR